MTPSAMPSKPSTSSPCSSSPPDKAPKLSLTRSQILAEIQRLYARLQALPGPARCDDRRVGVAYLAYDALVQQIRSLTDAYKATADDDDKNTDDGHTRLDGNRDAITKAHAAPIAPVPAVQRGRATVNVTQAALRCQVRRRTIHRWLQEGRIAFVRTESGQVRIFEDSLFRERDPAITVASL